MEIVSNQATMEDLKSQDTDLSKEFAKIKAMQAKLAKKLKGQEKDKATSQTLSSCPETVSNQEKKPKDNQNQGVIVVSIIAVLFILAMNLYFLCKPTDEAAQNYKSYASLKI